jgi:hypothetical protein
MHPDKTLLILEANRKNKESVRSREERKKHYNIHAVNPCTEDLGAMTGESSTYFK